MKIPVGNIASIELSGTPEPQVLKSHHGSYHYKQEADRVQTRIDIRNPAGNALIHWPNREGESFHPEKAHRVLSDMNRTIGGISLCWPATASTQAIAVSDENEIHIIHTDPESSGRVRFLRVESPTPNHIRFTFTGTSAGWKVFSLPLKKEEAPLAAIDRDMMPGGEKKMWQLGLIAADGNSAVSTEEGFAVLERASKRVISAAGRKASGDILHVFGYASGHDRGYPDYTPNLKLGGPGALARAISRVEALGFETSLYMNARLAESELLRGDEALTASVLQDSAGKPVIENYCGRDFAVMNPNSSAWRERLLREARKLISLGTQWIQLDQIAGRAAPVSPGTPWGIGYTVLIEEIQAMGAQVWIQGVSDLYPADAFEATWRPVTVLDDGTLRGGFPFGHPDTSLLEASGFNGTLIMPGKKTRLLASTGLKTIEDANSEEDILPLWGNDWPNVLKINNSSQ